METAIDRRARRAARAVAAQLRGWAEQGTSAPARLLGDARGFVEWAHYPQPDAVDPVSRWKFYYHCHPRRERLRVEHGHVHVFVPAGRSKTEPTEGYSHLIGMSFDAAGLPVRLFTTNGWVTDEVWQPASALHDCVRKPGLRHAQPADVATWIENLLIVYGAEVHALLDERDRRLADNPARDPVARRNDFRLRLPSQRRIGLLTRLAQLDAED